LILTDYNVARTTYYDNYTLSYEISPKTAVYVQGQHIGYDYEEGVRLYDQTTLAGAGGFAYQAFSKTVLFGEAFYGVTTSDPNVRAPETPDMTFAGGALGARGAFTPKLIGNVRIGYETREFDGRDASNDPVVSLGLNYRFSTKTEIALGYSRRQDVSIQFDEQTYTAKVANLQLTQVIGSRGKWRATLGGYYGFYNYDASQFSLARDYDVYSINFGVAYQIQLWLSASLNFERTGVIGSARDVTEYDVNRLTFRLAVGY
jgi:long-subunit fatty acid transport protein